MPLAKQMVLGLAGVGFERCGAAMLRDRACSLLVGHQYHHRATGPAYQTRVPNGSEVCVNGHLKIGNTIDNGTCRTCHNLTVGRYTASKVERGLCATCTEPIAYHLNEWYCEGHHWSNLRLSA